MEVAEPWFIFDLNTWPSLTSWYGGGIDWVVYCPDEDKNNNAPAGIPFVLIPLTLPCTTTLAKPFGNTSSLNIPNVFAEFASLIQLAVLNNGLSPSAPVILTIVPLVKVLALLFLPLTIKSFAIDAVAAFVANDADVALVANDDDKACDA